MRTHEETARAVVGALSDELRRPPYRSHWHPLAGHCYVASEAFWHLTGRTLRPQVVRIKGGTHWYLRDASGGVWDWTHDPQYVSLRARRIIRRYNFAWWQFTLHCRFSINQLGPDWRPTS